MRLANFLHSTRGNSLLTVLGATTILGVIAYYSSQSLVNRVKASRGLATKTEFTNLVDYVHLILSDSAACQLNFKNKIIALDAADFQTNSSFDPATLQLVVPGLVSGTKNLARVGDAVGDMNLTEIKFKVEGKLGTGLSASLNFKVARPTSQAPTRSSGVSERSGRIMLTVVTSPTTNVNEVTIVDCTANSLGLTASPPSGNTNVGLSGSWSAFPKGVGGRMFHSAIWTGSKMIVWGGSSVASNQPVAGHVLNTGVIYDPGQGTLVPMSTTGAPSARGGHSAIWTDSKMIIWGGFISSSGTLTATNDGAMYDPVTDSWAPISQEVRRKITSSYFGPDPN